MEKEAKGYDLNISINNCNLSYDDVGEGNVPVIFLHGFPFDRTMWMRQLDFFKSSYRLIAFDIRGFGKSTVGEGDFSIDLFTDDLIAFMDELNIPKAIVCGLSMGGYIALNMQQRFPQRIEALILADTQCIADTTEAKEKRYKTIEEIKAQGDTQFKEGFIKNVFAPSSLEGKKEIVQQLRNVVTATAQDSIIKGLKALAERRETCSGLNKISIPTLIICGKEDQLTPLAQSEMMQAAINGSVIKIINEAGHVSNLEQPEVFNKYLQDFFSTLSVVNAGNFNVD